MARDELIEARLTHSVIGAFYEVYTTLGFGFFESTYANALELELRARGHRVAREVPIQVVYKGHVVGLHRLDQLVDGKLIVETKSSHDLARGALRQVPSYLKAAHLGVGLAALRPRAAILPLCASRYDEQSDFIRTIRIVVALELPKSMGSDSNDFHWIAPNVTVRAVDVRGVPPT